jgi:beta-aspartyl-peptidase (threonine type)
MINIFKSILITSVLLLLLFWNPMSLFDASADNPKFAIAIHGGAGTMDKNELVGDVKRKYEDKLKQAVDTGYALLEQGKSSQEAVIAAIKVLENSPLFNAGKGAVYTFDGEHELDASIMDGKTLQAGAVAGIKTVKNPIELAKAVMDKSVHVLLSGKGAEAFSIEQGIAQVSNNYFDTEHRYNSLLKAKKKLLKTNEELKDFRAAHDALPIEFKVGTVGAVALDKEGNIAAGTSTGGMTAKRYGRVGDSPIIGAGTYANNASCAVSATGHGEFFIRYHVAADICARVEYQGISLQQAADTVINGVLKDAGGTGGIIAIDTKANITMPFNTAGMYRASRSSNGKFTVAIF